MDADRFDTFVKRLATGGTSRRRLLRGVGGGLLGAILGTGEVGANPPEKHCKFQGYNCKTNADCCSLLCCDRTCCGDGQSCCGGQCVASCTGGQVLNASCQCACPSGTVLVNGTCCTPTTCPTGACGLTPNGCGGTLDCGSCPSDQICTSGQCVTTTTTAPPTTTTTTTLPPPSCTATTCPDGCCDASGTCQVGTSASACGSGGAACVVCGGGLACCGGACVNLLSDNANCGACGTACTNGATCSHGNCCFSSGGCACSPTGFACDSQTCCQHGAVGSCTAAGTCP